MSRGHHVRSTMQVFPVIHYVDRRTAYVQLCAARRNGASGVFLVAHNGHDDELMGFAAEAKVMDPHFAIGINLQGRLPVESLEQACGAGVNMVWCSEVGISSSGLTAEGEDLAARLKEAPQIRLFAAVALRPSCVEQNPAEAARIALAAGFLPVTSALATTGYTKDDKISAMFASTQGQLAVAGGGTADSAFDYAPYFHHVLMASGHQTNEPCADLKKVKSLIAGAAWPDALAFG